MEILAFAVLAGLCVVLSGWDLRERRLPNSLTGTLLLGVLGYALGTAQFTAAMVGALLLAVPYLLVHLVAPHALGAGDVKLAAGLGAAAGLGGAHTWVCAAVAAPFLTAGVGVVALCADRIRRRTQSAGPYAVPHGPAMCAATLLALVAAPP
ncbi:A24 family peptidase [Nocardia goodfellowii]|uniref:Leader peptidase (Prepilin peptidase)/N-methyltransferase n=1 Tax=Nocardia goodfellowii TaxID=882446 RepID=A0ABS4QJ31_9NOCA|nr:A24 family peptidase [Nocardia goodfellowii]MBP2190676.1 leader peptidase (prepilin peptidase)/N-methyltransferase [Nocardia goodfellowii]